MKLNPENLQSKSPIFKSVCIVGPSGDNGFEQATNKSKFYGTCVHFSPRNRSKSLKK